MQAIEKKYFHEVTGAAGGWVFTKTDFVAGYGEVNIRQALSSLARAGTMRDGCHGVYD